MNRSPHLEAIHYPKEPSGPHENEQDGEPIAKGRRRSLRAPRTDELMHPRAVPIDPAAVTLAVGEQLAGFLQQLTHVIKTQTGTRSIAAATPKPVNAYSGVVAASGTNWLMGWMLNETTGSASAVVKLYDGLNTDGPLIGTLNLNPGESDREFFPGGVGLAFGLYYQVVSGSVAGSVFVGVPA